MPTMTDLEPTRAAALFRALSDEKRVAVVSLLAAGEHCVCELTEALGVAQPLLSFHLKTLKDAGVVTDRREGRWVYYALVPEALGEAGALLAGLAGGVSRGGREPLCP